MEKETLHVYTRVSKQVQVKGYSLSAQQKLGIAKAKELGMKCKLHIEPGESGAKDTIDNRPVLQNLLDMGDDGIVKHIYFTEFDRLTRSPIFLEANFKIVIIQNGVMLYTTSQRIDLRNEEDDFMVSFITLLSKRENTLRVKRSKRGMAEAVKKGKWQGILLPWGYTRDKDRCLVIDKEEAKIYRKMVEWSLRGFGSNIIAHKLNELEIPTRGKKVLLNGSHKTNKFTREKTKINNDEFVWRAGTVIRILKNPIAYGCRIYNHQQYTAPAIIDKETFLRVQENLKKNKNYATNHAKYFYLLRGNLGCRRCGANLYGKIKPDERTYMCSSKRYKHCGTRSVNLDKLNELVWEIITDNEFQLECLKDELKSTDMQKRLVELEEGKARVENQIASIAKRLENLIILFEKGKISLEGFDRRDNELRQEKSRLIEELERVDSKLQIHAKQVDMLKQSDEETEILKSVNSWTNEDKKVFVNRKVKNIIVNWNEALWEHIIEITFEAGFQITQHVFLRATNPPAGRIGTPRYFKQRLKTMEKIWDVSLNSEGYVIPKKPSNSMRNLISQHSTLIQSHLKLEGF